MPYVEGFGTWPFGEEWLWEAIAGSYLPLLDLLDEGAPLTLSLTPVLCDQLEAPGVGERFEAFVDEVRRAHPRARTSRACARAATRRSRASWSARGPSTSARCERFRERGGDLLGALRAARAVDLLGHARGAAAAGHRRGRAGAGADRRGLAPRALRRALGGRLLAARVRPRAAPGAAAGGSRRARHVRGAHQPLWPRRARAPAPARGRVGRGARADRPRDDRARVERRGLPRARELPRLPPPHDSPPQPVGQRRERLRPRARARRSAREHAARVRRRHDRAPARRERDASTAAGGDPLPGGGLVVCALDTELLGHWWYEGVDWLRAVVEECSRQGLVARAPRRSAPRCATRRRWTTPSGGRARGARTATCRPGRARRSPTWRSRRAPPSCARSPPAGAGDAACASCWRCRPPTGPSWCHASWPSPTRTSASRATASAGAARSRAGAVIGERRPCAT